WDCRLGEGPSCQSSFESASACANSETKPCSRRKSSRIRLRAASRPGPKSSHAISPGSAGILACLPGSAGILACLPGSAGILACLASSIVWLGRLLFSSTVSPWVARIIPGEKRADPSRGILPIEPAHLLLQGRLRGLELRLLL